MYTLTSFALWIFQTSIKATVLIAVLLLLKKIIGDKLPARWHFALWLLLMLRLIIPFPIESPFSLYRFPKFDIDRNSRAESIKYEIEQHQPKINATKALENLSTEHVSYHFTEPQLSADINNESNDQLSWKKWLSILWLAGIIIISMMAFISNIKLWRKIRSFTKVENAALLNLFETCKNTMKIHTPFELLLREDKGIPYLYGLLKPKIVLPRDIASNFSSENIRYIFMHELAHYKRMDVLTAWLATSLQIIHWFNPAIWYAFFQMRKDRELACDELTLSKIDAPKTTDYGNTLIAMLEHISLKKQFSLAVGILENKSDLKRRIKMIAQYKKSPVWISLIAVISLLFIGCFALTDAVKSKIETKPLAKNLDIIITSNTELTLNGKTVFIDALSDSLDKFQYNENSEFSILPEEEVHLDAYKKVLKQIRATNVKNMNYINRETGKRFSFMDQGSENYFDEKILKERANMSPINIDGTWGFKKGFHAGTHDIVIEPQFENAQFFNEGLAAVKKNGKWGYIDTSATVIIPYQFEAANWFENGLAGVKLNGKWGFITTTGKWAIQPQYDSVHDFSEKLTPAKIGSKWGYIDRKGKTKIDFQFEEALAFNEGRAAIKQNNKWGFLDEDGNIIVPPTYSSVGYFYDGYAWFKQNGKFGYIDKSGKVVIRPQYSEVGDFFDGLASVQMKNNKFGFINKAGEIIIEPIFDAAFEFSNGEGIGMGIIFENPELNIQPQTFTFDRAGNVFPNMKKQDKK